MEYKYRLKFSKRDNLKYIGHLDLITIIQRTIKRGKIPIAYSQGFNPHQMTAFALPLSLGAQSDSEYLEIVITENMDVEQLKKIFNEHIIEGLKILEVVKLERYEASGAKLLQRGTYEIILPKIQNLGELIDELMNQEEILVLKKTKKKTFKNTDIKGDIFDLKKIDKNTLTITISTGSQRNVKPDLVVEALYNLAEVEYVKNEVKILRTKMLYEREGKFLELINRG